MSGTAVHEAGMAPACATVVRKAERLTKDRAKALVAAGLQRALGAGGKTAKAQLALAGGTSTRCIEKALAQETLPGIDLLLNMLDEDASVLDELLKARGYRLTSLETAPSADLLLSAGLASVTSAFCTALADGRRDHGETLAIAVQLRALMPQLEGVIREADRLRGAA